MNDLVAAIEELSRYQAPSGWRIETVPGWSPSLVRLLENAADPNATWSVDEGATIEWSGARLPQFFTVDAIGPRDAGYLNIRLFMTLNHDRQVDLWGAVTSGPDLPSRLKELFQLRPIDWWKRQALLRLRQLDDKDLARALATARQPQTRRNNRITPSLLQEVAEVYRRAAQEGRTPTQHVADHFSISRANAGKWVARSRAEGFLGRSVGPTGGEVLSDE